MIKQSEIEDLKAQEETIKALKKKLKDHEAAFAGLEKDLMTRLSENESVAKGRYTLALEVVSGRVAPPWKELYLKHMEVNHGVSPVKAEHEAREHYPPKQSTELVIGIRGV